METRLGKIRSTQPRAKHGPSAQDHTSIIQDKLHAGTRKRANMRLFLDRPWHGPAGWVRCYH